MVAEYANKDCVVKVFVFNVTKEFNNLKDQVLRLQAS